MFVLFDDTAGVEVGKRALGGHSLLSLLLLSVDLRENHSCFVFSFVWKSVVEYLEIVL